MFPPAGFVFLLAGCYRVEPVDVARTRARCGLETDESRPVMAYADLPVHVELLDVDCVVALGEDVGLDWEAFGTEPAPVGAYHDNQDPFAHKVIWALYTLLLLPGDDIEQVLEDPMVPPVLLDALNRVQHANGYDTRLPANYLYYGLVAGRTREIVPFDDDYPSSWATYRAFESRIKLDTWDGLGMIHHLTGLLVHEVMHTWVDHVPCEKSSEGVVPVSSGGSDGMRCDLDGNGPYGASAWVMQRAAQYSLCDTDATGRWACSYSAGAVERACLEGIYDQGGFLPCESIAGPDPALSTELCFEGTPENSPHWPDVCDEAPSSQR